ncbi:MAG: ABC transporter substrate-binding protein [Chloroflexota bacterium]
MTDLHACTRREILALVGVSLASTALAACGGSGAAAAPSAASSAKPASSGSPSPSASASTSAPAKPSGSASAARIRLGTPVRVTFPYLPIAVAQEKGLWKANHVNVEWVPFNGAGPLNQAIVAGQIKLGIGNGATVGELVAKGLKAKIIAEVLGVPVNMVVIVPGSSPIKQLADLKGKRLGITSFGSATDFFALSIAAVNKWDPKTGIIRVPLGGLDAQAAALKAGQIDAMMWTLEGAYALQQKAGTRIVDSVDKVVPKFEFESLLAKDDLMASDEGLIRDVPHGWYQAVAYMKSHRSETVDIASKQFKIGKDIMGKVYDRTMPAMSTNGALNPQGMSVSLQSLKVIGAMKKPPAVKDVFTQKFVPVNV